MTVLIFNMKFYFIFEKDLKYCFVCPGLQSQSWKSSLLLIIYKLPISMPRNKINDPIINIFSQKMIYSRFLIPMFCLKFLFFTVFFTKQYLISRHIRTHLKLYYYTMSFDFNTQLLFQGGAHFYDYLLIFKVWKTDAILQNKIQKKIP